MTIHYVPVGIEANSQEEAEQKILKLQHIASQYKPPEQQPEPIDPLYGDLFKLAVFLGAAWLNSRSEKNAHHHPKESNSYVKKRKKRNEQKKTGATRAELR